MSRSYANPIPGDTLLNGATLVSIVRQPSGTYVLAQRLACPQTVQPYVTWALGPDGHTHSGHYFNTLEAARADLLKRACLTPEHLAV